MAKAIYYSYPYLNLQLERDPGNPIDTVLVSDPVVGIPKWDQNSPRVLLSVEVEVLYRTTSNKFTEGIHSDLGTSYSTTVIDDAKELLYFPSGPYITHVKDNDNSEVVTYSGIPDLTIDYHGVTSNRSTKYEEETISETYTSGDGYLFTEFIGNGSGNVNFDLKSSLTLTTEDYGGSGSPEHLWIKHTFETIPDVKITYTW